MALDYCPSRAQHDWSVLHNRSLRKRLPRKFSGITLKNADRFQSVNFIWRSHKRHTLSRKLFRKSIVLSGSEAPKLRSFCLQCLAYGFVGTRCMLLGVEMDRTQMCTSGKQTCWLLSAACNRELLSCMSNALKGRKYAYRLCAHDRPWFLYRYNLRSSTRVILACCRPDNDVFCRPYDHDNRANHNNNRRNDDIHAYERVRWFRSVILMPRVWICHKTHRH